jgi:hypothetical protein
MYTTKQINKLTLDDIETKACFYFRYISFDLSVEFDLMIHYVVVIDFPSKTQYVDHRKESENEDDVV